jgi:hypothetical protein
MFNKVSMYRNNTLISKVDALIKEQDCTIADALKIVINELEDKESPICLFSKLDA